jgi:hypothetical protein
LAAEREAASHGASDSTISWINVEGSKESVPASVSRLFVEIDSSLTS